MKTADRRCWVDRDTLEALQERMDGKYRTANQMIRHLLGLPHVPERRGRVRGSSQKRKARTPAA